MKKYLAIFLGTTEAMDKWKAMPDEQRKPMEKEGMEAWMKWTVDNKASIVDGSPLGKTKRVDKNGVSDVKNNMGAWTVVEAESQEAAAELFKNHPHFMIFPGECIEIMECIPIPKMES